MESRFGNSGLFRKVALGGALATLPLINSGCVPLGVAAAAYYVAEHDAAVVQANATRDAARIQAGGNSGQNHTNKNSPRWEIFTCTAYSDFNKDGFRCPKTEVVDKGKTEFYVGDMVKYVAIIWNCKGKEIALYGQNTPGAELSLSYKKIVDTDARIYDTANLPLNEPANWHAYWTLDGVKIGEHRIAVREDPSKTGGVGKR